MAFFTYWCRSQRESCKRFVARSRTIISLGLFLKPILSQIVSLSKSLIFSADTDHPTFPSTTYLSNLPRLKTQKITYPDFTEALFKIYPLFCWNFVVLICLDNGGVLLDLSDKLVETMIN